MTLCFISIFSSQLKLVFKKWACFFGASEEKNIAWPEKKYSQRRVHFTRFVHHFSQMTFLCRRKSRVILHAGANQEWVHCNLMVGLGKWILEEQIEYGASFTCVYDQRMRGPRKEGKIKGQFSIEIQAKWGNYAPTRNFKPLQHMTFIMYLIGIKT